MLRALGHQAAGQAKAPDMTDEAIWPGLIAAIITALVSLILFLLLASAPAKAATITAKGNVIEIKGDIELGDSDKFSAKLGAFPDTKIVSLNSRGGRARDAYRIGVLLRIWEMGTIVPEGQTCQSACVVIWAAGIWRELAPGASLYMHCHFRVEGLNKVKDLSKIDLKTVKCSDVANENLARYTSTSECRRRRSTSCPKANQRIGCSCDAIWTGSSSRTRRRLRSASRRGLAYEIRHMGDRALHGLVGPLAV
jgi:hypothetical protein